jgi:hypothetical protein
VAAIPPAERQTQIGFSEPSFVKGGMPQSAQRPAARDMVSKVLRARALWQALRSRKRPIVAIGGNPSPERRAGLVTDVPTNALPVRRVEPPSTKPKPGSASLQRKPQHQEGRPVAASRQQAPMAAAASKQRTPSVSEGGPRLETRRPQQQAVSDILSGGL